MIDLEKSEKLPPDKRYFNISIIWIFYFRYVIRALYHLRIPHEIITLLSIAFGITAAVLYQKEAFILAAVALHLKDIFDASDGAIARLTGRGHLIGRYLDSLGDFLALTLVMGSIVFVALDNHSPIYLIWGALAIFSTFIQCSFFNYYQLAYLEAFGIESLSSKRDEISRDDFDQYRKKTAARILLKILRFFYRVVYSWQDKLVSAVDQKMFENNCGMNNSERFGNKKLMVLQSALCFGTHIFVLIAFSIFGQPWLGLIFISIIMNFYLLLLLYLRNRYYKTGLRSIANRT